MSSELNLTRCYLKKRLLRDYTTFRGFDNERSHAKDLLLRTVQTGESNSALIVGPRGSAKTRLIGSVVHELMAVDSFVQNSVIIYLNGLVHLDDKLALKSIANQLRLQNAVDGKVFGSFSENLAFLLACLKSGDKKRSKSCVFILDEFDLFCGHHNQTLLYNLFDVAQSAQAPICVMGLTCRLDVVELLEKRVKSRFSHRQIFLHTGEQDWTEKWQLFEELLSIPTNTKRTGEEKIELQYLDNCEMYFLRDSFNCTRTPPKGLSQKWISEWNQHVQEQICANEKVKQAVEEFHNFDNLDSTWKLIMLEIISRSCPTEALEGDCGRDVLPTVAHILSVFRRYESDEKVAQLCDLSVMELCLVISMKHHCEIYDRDPFNFEMIFKRLQKFANSTATMQQTCGRSAMMKAFECLCDAEIVGNVNSRTQREFQMYRLLLTFGQIKEALNRYQGLPTEVLQWGMNSLL